MCRLHRGATMESPSLALIRPRRVIGLKIESHPGWTAEQRAKIEQYVGQFDLFGKMDRSALEAPRYSGSYRYLCQDGACPGHQQGVLDWEFVALQRHLRDRDDSAAREALTEKFLAQMCGADREVAFYVGNQAKRPRVFSVLGVYWPKLKR